MATTPGRITPEGASAAGAPPEVETQDTERPPRMLAAEGSGEAARGMGTAPPVRGSGQAPGAAAAASGTEAPTRVGPAPDPGASASGRIGPPTPKNLRAAAPIGAGGAPIAKAAPKLAAAPPAVSSPAVTSAPVHGRSGPMAGLPMATDAPTPAGAAVVGGAPSAPAGAGVTGGVEGTAIGLAPSPRGAATARVTSPSRTPTRQTAALGEGPRTRRCTSCNELYPADFLVCPRDATPLATVNATEADDPLVGALIGDTYQIVRIIGEGGMGRVYEARHLRLKERRFAVKCMHAALARNSEMAARFLREAESASSIKHANVVDVFDVHHLPDGTPYLVGEFLEGEELADYVQTRGAIEPRAAAKIGRQVCSALAAAHARGIVHRDLKPENIFVLASSIAAVDRGESRTLEIKVLDFGISKAGHGDDSHLTRTGVIMGTPSYMAPEQARGRPVDHRADVYSLGACIYFMITGRRPFDSDDPTSTLSMVLTEDPLRPREIDPRIPEMLELIVQRAMAKDVNDRYASMGDLDRALTQFTDRPGPGGPSGPPVISLTPPAGPMSDATGAARALDVARAILGADSMAPASMQQSGDLARASRPTIVVMSGALGAWLIGGTVAALAGLVRVLHDGEVTLTESLLLVMGCVFAAATPAALYVLHVRRVIWPNSVRALRLATDLKRIAVAAFVTYGGLAIVGRIAHTVLWRTSRGLASGLWDILLFVLSLASAAALGGGVSLLRSLRRRSRGVTPAPPSRAGP